MGFGIFIDVPIVVGGFFLMLKYRKHLTRRLSGLRFSRLATCMLLSVPLIFLEENINCMPSWCGQTLIPPTLPALLLEIFAVGVIALRIHAKNVVRVVSVYSIFGVCWEALFGGLLGAPLVISAIFAPYVWISYGFVSLLPLSVLLEGKHALAASPTVQVVEPVVTPASTELK